MKAVIAAGINHDNPLSVLDVRDMPEPEPRLYWSTVSVKAATVNHHDLWSLQGVGLAESQTPMILGTDAAGILDEDIPGRNGLKAGSEVVLYTFVGNDGCWCCTRLWAMTATASCRGSAVRSCPSTIRARWPRRPRCPARTCSPSPRT